MNRIWDVVVILLPILVVAKSNMTLRGRGKRAKFKSFRAKPGQDGPERVIEREGDGGFKNSFWPWYTIASESQYYTPYLTSAFLSTSPHMSESRTIDWMSQAQNSSRVKRFQT
jgi:hypothetical protein